MNPKAILLDRYQKRSLAPLYIIRGPIKDQDSEALLKNWVEEFASEIISLEKNISLKEAKEIIKLGHSDLIFLKKDPDSKEYRLKDPSVQEFQKAHAYPPLEFKQKLIFVYEGQGLSETLANKWLKTLEEPLDSVITFLICSKPIALLQTVESRAITLRLPPEEEYCERAVIEVPFNKYLEGILEAQSRPSEKLLQYCRQGGPHILIDYIKQGVPARDFLFNTMNQYIELHQSSLRIKDKWLQELQWFKKAQAYNNSPAERFMGLIQVIEQCS